jgi:hypothetical protein
MLRVNYGKCTFFYIKIKGGDGGRIFCPSKRAACMGVGRDEI